jgi:hypothetical protein
VRITVVVTGEPALEPRRHAQRAALRGPQRQHRAARAGDADALVQLAHAAREVVGRVEHGVAVEHEQHVAVELARLALERRGLAERLLAHRDIEHQAVRIGELARELDRVVARRAAVIDQQDLARQPGLSQQRGQAIDDPLLVAAGRNDHVDHREPPVLGRRRHGRIGPAAAAERTEQRARTDHEPGRGGHRSAAPQGCARGWPRGVGRICNSGDGGSLQARPPGANGWRPQRHRQVRRRSQIDAGIVPSHGLGGNAGFSRPRGACPATAGTSRGCGPGRPPCRR